MPENNDTIHQLLKQLDIQTKINRSAVRAMNSALKMLRQQSQKEEPEQTCSLFSEEENVTVETAAMAEERRQNYYKDAREEIMKCFKTSHFAGKSKTVPVEEFVKEWEIDNLADVTEYTFLALLQRDFGSELADTYRQKKLGMRLFRKVLRYYDDLIGDHALGLDEALLAEAKRLEESAANAPVSEIKPTAGPFRLQGRQELEDFINTEVVDIVNHYEDYHAMGISFPKSFIMEGAPGCGKTYAAEALARHLGWYTIRISSGNIGSSYIHDTAKKIEEKFAEAAEHAPAIIIIDEIDAFAAKRNSDSQSNHHVEEVASFLRCLQDAEKKHILVVGMTNYLQNIDPAILRTGRMGNHIKVDMPSVAEIEAVLTHALNKRPHADFPLHTYAEQLQNRPLSDVTAAVDKAAVAAIHARHRCIEESDLNAAVKNMAKFQGITPSRPIGFVA